MENLVRCQRENQRVEMEAGFTSACHRHRGKEGPERPKEDLVLQLPGQAFLRRTLESGQCHWVVKSFVQVLHGAHKGGFDFGILLAVDHMHPHGLLKDLRLPVFQARLLHLGGQELEDRHSSADLNEPLHEGLQVLRCSIRSGSICSHTTTLREASKSYLRVLGHACEHLLLGKVQKLLDTYLHLLQALQFLQCRRLERRVPGGIFLGTRGSLVGGIILQLIPFHAHVVR
mmetsp:Transcript_23411/g.41180  ORF Transcript_23411/g.41180 Transcript_23411/m.41180 type:complete len:230 (+) Transcript_23411:74-763(+)